ncbi:NitT/TauT family transport system ATP-binding protein [Clostridium sp. DSM 8431]|uniref:ABC transporter ATP-binding protein n=1 Tax=Clostridium sp. DSM 8431 TaxID=1761781 RepID=UPI0008F1F694|nr:ABC transporter ATP-binding protein [Clostridium sp. DSM 8431]SFU41037.1 NitT/TauT family transport system ATP-binding protein [Clostridium sp. DSM 8431]
MIIEISNLNKSFKEKQVFDNFSITLDDTKINCIIGASGGGKSTLLNIIAGLLKEDSGEIKGACKSEISYIFQEDRLVPWLTIRENIELFIFNYYEKAKAYEIMERMFKLLNLENIIDKYPKNLSGGMKQRINIARALIKPSKIILMDEPFKSLDYKTKYTIMKELKGILKKENRMVIFVTHDVDEAIFMEGRIFVLGGSPFSVKGIFEENLEENKEKIIEII